MRKVNHESLTGVLYSLPILGIGIVIGQRLKPKLNEDNSRRFVLILLFAAGLSALIGAIAG